MIGDGIYNAQLEAIEGLLKKLKLLAERQLFPNDNLSVSHFRGKSYRDVYELVIQELQYNFRMSDQALISFRKTGNDIHDGSLSFAYYEAPALVSSYETFVGSQTGIEPGDPAFQANIDEWGDLLVPEYEDYVRSTDLKASVTPLRYDCKATDYKAGIHPAAHMHFGVQNDIRVGLRYVMTPLSFVLFVIRQRYPASWRAIQEWDDCDLICRNIRTALDLVDVAYWENRDEQEIYLI